MLSPAAYEALKLLRRAYPGGLDRGQMDRAYHRSTGWRTTLARLKAADPDWDAAIGFPRDSTRLGATDLYRILPW
jgi:hypothetical protein